MGPGAFFQIPEETKQVMIPGDDSPPAAFVTQLFQFCVPPNLLLLPATARSPANSRPKSSSFCLAASSCTWMSTNSVRSVSAVRDRCSCRPVDCATAARAWSRSSCSASARFSRRIRAFANRPCFLLHPEHVAFEEFHPLAGRQVPPKNRADEHEGRSGKRQGQWEDQMSEDQ